MLPKLLAVSPSGHNVPPSLTQKSTPKNPESNGSNRMDIIIRNATVITLDKTRRIIKDGSIGIKNGKIDWIDDAQRSAERVATLDIDARNRIVMPGLINPHCHVSHSMARGCGDDLHFLKWLPVVYSVEDAYTDEEWYLTSLLTMIEMIKSGTTCFADTNVFEEFDWVAQ